jgi:uncharacterized protein DUF3500
MTAAEELTRVVRAWFATLDDTQRALASFPFDTEERFAWAYTPGRREGLALADMRPNQRAAAMAMVEAAMSERGASEVAAVIALEEVLGALERAHGRSNWIRRDPELYWFAVFGEPAPNGAWSWRLGGHHVAIHVTVNDGRVVASTPSFLGSNPAVVPDGPTAGARTLTGEEVLAREFLATLSPEARAIAVVDRVAPPDIHSGNGARADLRSIPSGIRHDDLSRPEQDRLEGLVRHYLGRAPDDVAAASWERIVDAGLAPITFAWAGAAEPGRGHYYAVRGPRFLIEYDNTQNDANHIHAVWRDLTNDWGEDRLAAHYRTAHGEAG